MITDLGIVSSISNNQQEVLAFLREGRSGVTFSQELKDSGVCSHVWNGVELDTIGLIDRKIVRFMNGTSIYAFLSMEQAVANTDPMAGDYQNNPCANLIVGPGGGSPCLQVFGVDAMRSPRGPKVVGPYVVTGAMASGVSTCLAAPFKIHDVNYSISSARAISVHCIDNAVEQVQLDKQDIVFAGSGEELCWEVACEFDVMGALSTKYDDAPEKVSRAHNAHRDGFAITDDDGMVVVEESERVPTHGVHIYAEIVGCGATSDGADTAAPSGKGTVCCIQMAMHGVDTPVNYPNSYGTPTPVGDMKELGAAREMFGDNSPTASATKAMTGHFLGAAGTQEVIYFLLMLEHGSIAPSINIEELDGQAAGLNIMTKPTEQALTIMMSNSFGSGGANATPVMRKPKA